MKTKKIQMIVLVILLSLMLVLATVVLAQTLEKPYAEGLGGQNAGKSLASVNSDKGYPEGQGSTSTGSRIESGDVNHAAPEGQAGKSGSSSAGIDSLRAPEGMSVRLMFSGVTDDGQQGSADRKEATSIHCTNSSTVDNVEVEVIVYQWNGTDFFTGTVNMPPMRTFTFSTQNTTIYFDDVILGGSPGTDAIFQGSGVVYASSRDVICTAQALDPINYPPVFITSLEMYQP